MSSSNNLNVSPEQAGCFLTAFFAFGAVVAFLGGLPHFAIMSGAIGGLVLITTEIRRRKHPNGIPTRELSTQTQILIIVIMIVVAIIVMPVLLKAVSNGSIGMNGSSTAFIRLNGTDTYYHTSTCVDVGVDIKEYPVDQLKQQGYSPCPKCILPAN